MKLLATCLLLAGATHAIRVRSPEEDKALLAIEKAIEAETQEMAATEISTEQVAEAPPASGDS